MAFFNTDKMADLLIEALHWASIVQGTQPNFPYINDCASYQQLCLVSKPHTHIFYINCNS